MVKVLVSIKRMGNGLCVPLPPAVVREACLRVDQPVRVVAEGGRVVMEPLQTDWLSLDDRLARYDLRRHGGEVMGHAPGGAERC